MRNRTPTSKYIDSLIETWIKEYKSGANCPSIANKYNVHKSTVNRRLNENGVAMRSISYDKMADKNPNWSNNPSVHAIHLFVKHRKPKPVLCEECCDKPPLDLANISNTYNPITYTRDLNNWEWLCRRCHMVKDGRLQRMYHGGKPATYIGCRVYRCTKDHEAKGLCRKHYNRVRYWIKTKRVKDYYDVQDLQL